MGLWLAMLAPLTVAVGCGDPLPVGDDGGPVPDGGSDAGRIDEDGGPDRIDSGRPDGGSPDGGPPDAGPDAPDGGPPEPPDGGPIIWTVGELAIIATLTPLPALPPDTTNIYADDPAAAALGQALFFDARYSGAIVEPSDLGAMGETGRVSCASCHSSEVMSDDRSVPDNVSLGTNFHSRNAPAIVNSAYYQWTNWGGRFSAQWELPPVVAENGAIMNSSRLAIAHHIFTSYRAEYEAVFGAMDPGLSDFTRFPATGKPKPTGMGVPDGPWELMTAADRAIVNRIFINYGKAIQAYQRQLVSRDSDFDRYVAGDEDAIPESARRGLRVFMGPGRCVACHSGPTFSDDEFHNIGVQQEGLHVPMSDDGRFKDIPGLLGSPFNSAGAFSDDAAEGARRLAGLTVPPPESSRGAFRTPTLRDLAFTAPYMHSGQEATLEDVIAFYDMGGHAPVSGMLDDQMFVLGLTAQERADLLDFLDTLTSDPLPIELRSAP